YDRADEVGGEVQQRVQPLEVILDRLALMSDFKVQRGIRLEGTAQGVVIPEGLQHGRRPGVAVAAEGRHEGLRVGHDDALLRISLTEVPDDGPVGGVNRAPGAELESRVLPDAGIAGDELKEARVKHPAFGEVKFRIKLGREGAGEPDERKENAPVRQAPVSLDQHHGCKHHEGLTVTAFLDPRQVEHGVGLVPRDTAPDALRAEAGEHHTVVARVAQRLPSRPRTHRQHRDQYRDRAGHADDDRQDRADALSEARQAHGEQRDELSAEAHAAPWPASAVATLSLAASAAGTAALTSAMSIPDTRPITTTTPGIESPSTNLAAIGRVNVASASPSAAPPRKITSASASMSRNTARSVKPRVLTTASSGVRSRVD